MRRRILDRRFLGGVAIVAGLLLLNVCLSAWSVHRLFTDTWWVAHTHEVVTALEQAQGLMLDAESAQRGYIISGDEGYLRSYDESRSRAVDVVDRIQGLIGDNPGQRDNMSELRRHVDARLASLAENVERRRTEGFAAAQRFLVSDRGRRETQAIKDVARRMLDLERSLLQARAKRTDATYAVGLGTTIGAGLVGFGVVIAFLWQNAANLLAARRSAATLHEERERLRVTLASIGDAVIATDSVGNVRFMNEVAQQLTGWPEAEAAGRPLVEVFNIVNEETRRQVENPIVRVLREGVVVGLANHTVLISRDGRERPIDDNAAPIRDADDRLMGAVLVFRDDSSRRQIEKDLEHARKYAESIVNTLREGLVVISPDLRVRSANRAFYDMFGLTKADTESSSLYELSDGVWNSPRIRSLLEEILPKESSTENFEFEHSIPGRGKRYMLANARRLVAGGNGDDLILWAIEDVSDRKHAIAEVDRLLKKERQRSLRLRELADASRSIHVSNTRDSVERVVLAEAKRLLAAESARLDSAGAIQDDDESRDSPGELSAPVRGRGGRLWGRLAVTVAEGPSFSDDDRSIIDQLANIAAVAFENASFYEELRERDRRKDEFLATLAHELRNPLAPIRNALEIMKRADGDRALMESSRAVLERQVRQMVRLIDDLIDISRIKQGRLELRFAPTNLAEVIEAAREICKPLCEEAAHELAVELPEAPVVFEADAVRLAQVFGNIFSNAVKYSPRGSRTEVVARVAEDVVEVTIRDHGIGIDPLQLSRVFEMFTRIDDSADRAPEGLGVGLPLAQSLARMHGGSIEASSAGRGCGSEFVVRLPLAQRISVIARPADLASDPSAPVRPRRILVVDDNVDSAESMAAMLQLSGHDVATANDGQAALDRVETFEPDIVLLDIGLPRVSGYDVARQLRMSPRGEKLVLIALTGWGAEEDRRRSREAGFDFHLTKPVEPDTLARLIK